MFALCADSYIMKFARKIIFIFRHSLIHGFFFGEKQTDSDLLASSLISALMQRLGRAFLKGWEYSSAAQLYRKAALSWSRITESSMIFGHRSRK